MSFMHFDAVTAAAVPGAVVSLGAGAASHFDSNSARAGWKFTSIGTVFKIRGFFETQFNSNTDWIIPNDSASIDYEIRCHQIPGGISVVGDTQDTFLTLDTTRQWTASCQRFCSQFGTIQIDIRFQDGTAPRNNVSSLFDGAPVMASTNYTISIQAL